VSLFGPMLRSTPLVRNKEVLRASYTPPRLQYREAEARALARVLAPALQGGRTSHVLVTGRSGSGRSVLLRHVTKELLATASEQGLAVSVVHLDCGLVDTHYRILAHAANHFIPDWMERIPPAGLATGEVYERLRRRMDEANAACVVVLDGIDRFVRKNGGGALASFFTLADGLKRSRLYLVGIADSAAFLDMVDPIFKDRLTEESPINLAPYDAAQVRAILHERATMALREGCVAEEAFDACVVAASRNGNLAHGLGVLRMAAELAEQAGQARVRVEHVTEAEARLSAASVAEAVRDMPLQMQLVLLSCIVGAEATDLLTTGDVYDTYRDFTRRAHVETLTQRRVTDLLDELDAAGVLEARVISRGCYGRTKALRLRVLTATLRGILAEDPVISALTGLKPNRAAHGAGVAEA
jgi:archaeal cell division control protein 6